MVRELPRLPVQCPAEGTQEKTNSTATIEGDGERGREGGVRVGGWVKWKGWFMKVEECRGNRGQSVVCV